MNKPSLPFSDVLAYLALGRWVQLSRANAERVGKLDGYEVQASRFGLGVWFPVIWYQHTYKPRTKYRGRKVAT